MAGGGREAYTAAIARARAVWREVVADVSGHGPMTLVARIDACVLQGRPEYPCLRSLGIRVSRSRWWSPDFSGRKSSHFCKQRATSQTKGGVALVRLATAWGALEETIDFSGIVDLEIGDSRTAMRHFSASSGFFISSSGYMVTDWHRIADARHLIVVNAHGLYEGMLLGVGEKKRNVNRVLNWKSVYADLPLAARTHLVLLSGRQTAAVDMLNPKMKDAD